MKFWAGVSLSTVVEEMNRDLKRLRPTDSKKIVPDDDKVVIMSDF